MYIRPCGCSLKYALGRSKIGSDQNERTGVMIPPASYSFRAIVGEMYSSLAIVHSCSKSSGVFTAVLGIPIIVPPHTLVRRPPFSHAGIGISFIFPLSCGISCFHTSPIQSGMRLHTTYPSSFSLFPPA